MATRKRKRLDIDEEQQSDPLEDEHKSKPSKKRKVELIDDVKEQSDGLPFSLPDTNNNKTIFVSEQCILCIVALELDDDPKGIDATNNEKINVIDSFQKMTGGTFSLDAEALKSKGACFSVAWQDILQKAAKDRSLRHIHSEWERRVIAAESTFVHQRWRRAPQQKELRPRNTKLLSELLSVIRICGLEGALNKLRALIMNWMRDFGVTVDALRTGTEQLIHDVQEDMNMLFNAEWLKDKYLPPQAQILFDSNKYPEAVASVMMMDRTLSFQIEELTLCPKWLCGRRDDFLIKPRTPRFELAFLDGGICRVKSLSSAYGYRSEEEVEVEYAVKENNSQFSGAYKNNSLYLQIDHPILESNTFWCERRDENWKPRFVQCWKHETDYLIFVDS